MNRWSIPKAAIAYYQAQGVRSVLVEKKHTGSRAIVVVCRTEAAAVKRFGNGVTGLGLRVHQKWPRFLSRGGR